ncbi:unnamed protein product [Closterium sp. Naga37s-1]|nr:unnamed protein product [Closterium sp. Naga37s-1]
MHVVSRPFIPSLRKNCSDDAVIVVVAESEATRGRVRDGIGSRDAAVREGREMRGYDAPPTAATPALTAATPALTAVHLRSPLRTRVTDASCCSPAALTAFPCVSSQPYQLSVSSLPYPMAHVVSVSALLVPLVLAAPTASLINPFQSHLHRTTTGIVDPPGVTGGLQADHPLMLPATKFHSYLHSLGVNGSAVCRDATRLPQLQPPGMPFSSQHADTLTTPFHLLSTLWEKYADGYFSDGFYEMNLVAMKGIDEFYEDREYPELGELEELSNEADKSEDTDDTGASVEAAEKQEEEIVTMEAAAVNGGDGDGVNTFAAAIVVEDEAVNAKCVGVAVKGDIMVKGSKANATAKGRVLSKEEHVEGYETREVLSVEMPRRSERLKKMFHGLDVKALNFKTRKERFKVQELQGSVKAT